MKLRDLLQGVPVRSSQGNLDAEITAVVGDSRLAVRGSLFVAIRGMQQDGAKFVGSAVEKGATAVVSHHPLAACRSPRASGRREDARSALARIACNFFGH